MPRWTVQRSSEIYESQLELIYFEIALTFDVAFAFAADAVVGALGGASYGGIEHSTPWYTKVAHL